MFAASDTVRSVCAFVETLSLATAITCSMFYTMAISRRGRLFTRVNDPCLINRILKEEGSAWRFLLVAVQRIARSPCARIKISISSPFLPREGQ